MKTHWKNPWKKAIPIAPHEAALAVAMQMLRDRPRSNTPTWRDLLKAWRSTYGRKLDAYILPGPITYSLGVRYGPEGNQYLSPPGAQIVLMRLHIAHLERMRK